MGEANGIDSMELSSGMEPAHEITPVENGTSAPSTDSVSAPSQPMETDINKAVVEPVTNGNAVAASAPTETVAPTPAPPVRPALPPAPGSISSGLNIPMPLLQQFGEVFVGPGAEKEASLIGLGLKKLRTRDKDRLHDAKRQAMDVSIKTIMLRQQQTHQQNQQKQQMYAQALSLMARVYIGSISFEVREDMLKKAMEPFGPIKSLNMSWDAATGHHKGFAFLEYEVPEAAVLAQEAMNGLLMGGRNLKVGRPSNMPQAQPIIEMVQQESKKYFRVYVASVHPDLSENDVKSVFEAFGEVVSCKLARQGISGKGGHRGFGYIEFDNANSMNEAISGMNMFDLGGQFLRVGRCITPPEALNYIVPQTPSALPQSAAVALAAVTARVQALEATQSPKAGSSSPGSASPARAASPALPPPPHVNVPSPALTPPLPAVPAVAEPPAPAVIQPPPIATPSPPPLPVSHQEPPVLPQQSAAPPPPPPVPPVGQFSVPQIPPPAVVIPPPAVVVPPPAVVVPPPSVVVPPPTVVVPPPSVVIPPPGLAQIPPPSVVAPPKLATPISQASTSAGGTAQSLIDRIKLDRIKNKYKQASGGQASFAPLDEKYRPKDALAGNDEESGEQLAITGGSSKKSNDIQSLALALIEGGGAVATLKRRAEQEAAIKEATKKKRKIKPPKAKGPQLTTEAALAAAEKAGAMNDALIEKEVNSEEATLASQEGLEIRGNESRHLLMTKLMRITRSSVLLLKNMVGPEEIDEYLEGEVKEECSKYGHVEEVLIVNDEANAIVKIFVRFLDPKQVDEAKKALDGRFFAGRTISAVVYDQAMYDHGDYSA